MEMSTGKVMNVKKGIIIRKQKSGERLFS